MAVSDFFQTALQRLGAAASTVPTASDWAQVSLIIGATCAISLPIGLRTSKHSSPCLTCCDALANNLLRCTLIRDAC